MPHVSKRYKPPEVTSIARNHVLFISVGMLPIRMEAAEQVCRITFALKQPTN